ncbi:MAG: LamG domain-containing protein [Chthoniobacter sp.]|uniref:LamG domain-containing protein n=1 Tax=Chthoniobacter sp. TaxID=2510640 RepID=UPI0032A68DE2
MKRFPLLNASLALLMTALTSARADNYKDAVLRDKPFAYYRLGEADNTAPVADETGKNPGTFQNSPTAGEPGAIASDSENKSVSFARSQAQFIQLTEFGKFGSSMTHGFTVEYWLKAANFSDHQTIFGTANGPGFITDFLSDIAYTNHTKLLRMYIRDNHEDRYEAEFYPGGRNINIYDSAWHHIVQVYTPKTGGANNKVQFYVDGIRQTITLEHKGAARGNPVFSDFNRPLSLGSMNLRGTQQDPLDGSLDEVAFYTSVLSPEQIIAHYRASGAGDHLRVPR